MSLVSSAPPSSRHLILVLGIAQLLTPYHHLRTFAPTELPLNCALRFQCCHPSQKTLTSNPCASGMSICPRPIVSFQSPMNGWREGRKGMYLVLQRDQRNFPPPICITDTMQETLLEAQIGHGREAGVARPGLEDGHALDVIFGIEHIVQVDRVVDSSVR